MKKAKNIVFHPDALKNIGDEEAAHVLAEMADVLLPGGVERLTEKSRSLSETPPDGKCPTCGTLLVPDKVWGDEAECPNTACETYGKVAYVSDALAELLTKRMADHAEEHSRGRNSPGECRPD